MAPRESLKKRGECSRKTQGDSEDDSTNVTQLLGGLGREELLKFKAALEKQIEHIDTPSTMPSGRRGSSSSAKSINAPAATTDADDGEDDIINEEDKELEDDYDVTFSGLTKNREVTIVRGGTLHLDAKGQEWDTALGNAVKFYCTAIDRDWKKVSMSRKKQLVAHMEDQYGKGMMGRDILKRAGQKFNRWKAWLSRSGARDAPLHVKPEVWDRFIENKGRNRDQQIRAAVARKGTHGFGRRGHAGMKADYYRDWGSYPSAKTIRLIVEKGSYKAYRETLIDQGKVPGNFKAVDHIGKKGARTNKERKRQIKGANNDVHKNREEEEIVEGDVHEEGGNNGIEIVGGEGDVVRVEVEERHRDEFHGGGAAMVEGNDIDYDEDAIDMEGADGGTPDRARDMLVEKGIRKKVAEEATKRSDNASSSRKKSKKCKSKGIRNLSPDFMDATVTRNIAQYKSLQKGI